MGYEGGTIAEVLAKLQACLDSPEQAAHKGTNIRFYATQFFGEALLPRGTELSRDDLDRLDTTRPIRLRNADGHKFWMNSKAIDNARIDASTPVPPGGQIGRDASGRPNGFFADMDIEDWGETVPDSDAARVELVRRTNADANRMGITSVFVPGGGEDQIAQWAQVQDEGGLTLRVNLGLSADFVHGADRCRGTPQADREPRRLSKVRQGSDRRLERQGLLRWSHGVSRADRGDARAVQHQHGHARASGVEARHRARARAGVLGCEAGHRRARQGRLADPRSRDRRSSHARGARLFPGRA